MMKELRPCMQFQSDSTLTINKDKSTMSLQEQETMSTMKSEFQVLCTLIKCEPSSAVDLQKYSSVNLMTESSFSSYSRATNWSQTNLVQLENSSGQLYDMKSELATHSQQLNLQHDCGVKQEFHHQDAICSIKTEETASQELPHINIEPSAHNQQTNCKNENVVKLEFTSQCATCSVKTEQAPDKKLHYIKTEYFAHFQHSDVKHEFHSQDASWSIMTEHDHVQDAKTEEQLVIKQEQNDTHIVKTGTDLCTQQEVCQHDSNETVQEMSTVSCKTPEVMDIVTGSPQHQTNSCVTEVAVTIDSNKHVNSVTKTNQCKVCISCFRFPYLLKTYADPQ
ncbi:uncharacterized protein LOC112555511 [Pomacea canaliculata]|uniref:uncharacterized protein LOC112555511 n=1 Tax=Pomacea canaliculata TaxID=400727 RepID=UPI000D72F537|nr:uncharacterized protein LOC112555511 [Pomacea canaliculata]